jgi:hypothetical protein
MNINDLNIILFGKHGPYLIASYTIFVSALISFLLIEVYKFKKLKKAVLK